MPCCGSERRNTVCRPEAPAARRGKILVAAQRVDLDQAPQHAQQENAHRDVEAGTARPGQQLQLVHAHFSRSSSVMVSCVFLAAFFLAWLASPTPTPAAAPTTAATAAILSGLAGTDSAW